MGQIEEVHITDSCLTDGEPDANKIEPFLWVTRPANQFYAFGRSIGEAFSIGKHLKR